MHGIETFGKEMKKKKITLHSSVYMRFFAGCKLCRGENSIEFIIFVIRLSVIDITDIHKDIRC